jgi:hypothetical protein
VLERLKRSGVPFAIAVWLASIGGGFYCLWAYSAGPGAAAQAPREAPPEIRAWQIAGRPLIVMALHPHCPCSQASIDELADVLGWTPDAAELVLLIYKPAGERDSWITPSLAASLARFHPRIVIDADGRRAESLGVRTSGHVIAYDGDGRLAFSGGVTSARGHRGDSFGQEVLRALLRGEPRAPALTAPTYGCAIQDCVSRPNQP